VTAVSTPMSSSRTARLRYAGRGGFGAHSPDSRSDAREPSLRELLTLLDWMRERTELARPSRTEDPIPTAAAALLDGAGAILGIHRPGTLPDGSLYCAVCLGETGSRAWPCQTVRAFGLAVLRHWTRPDPDRPESAADPHPLAGHDKETRGPRVPPWI